MKFTIVLKNGVIYIIEGMLKPISMAFNDLVNYLSEKLSGLLDQRRRQAWNDVKHKAQDVESAYHWYQEARGATNPCPEKIAAEFQCWHQAMEDHKLAVDAFEDYKDMKKLEKREKKAIKGKAKAFEEYQKRQDAPVSWDFGSGVLALA